MQFEEAGYFGGGMAAAGGGHAWSGRSAPSSHGPSKLAPPRNIPEVGSSQRGSHENKLTAQQLRLNVWQFIFSNSTATVCLESDTVLVLIDLDCAAMTPKWPVSHFLATLSSRGPRSVASWYLQEDALHKAKLTSIRDDGDRLRKQSAAFAPLLRFMLIRPYSVMPCYGILSVCT